MREVRELLKKILCDFIYIEVVRKDDPFTLDIHKPGNRHIMHVYLGVSATATLSVLQDRSSKSKAN